MRTLWKITLPKPEKANLAQAQTSSRNQDMLNQNFKALFDAVTALEKRVSALSASSSGGTEGGA